VTFLSDLSPRLIENAPTLEVALRQMIEIGNLEERI